MADTARDPIDREHPPEADALRQWLRRPELRPLVSDTELDVRPLDGPPFRVTAPGRLAIDPETLARPGAAIHLRHGLELAWLRGLAPERPALAGLLAARNAALYLVLEPPAVRAATRDDPALALLASLAGGEANAAFLRLIWPALRPYQSEAPDALEAAEAALAVSLWPLTGPAEHLMMTGGDSRLRIDPATGLNKYGCTPRPRPWAITFASCTASSISERGYGGAEACRRRIWRAALAGDGAQGLHAEAELIRAGILDHWGVADLADIVLAPSGTDATLLLAALVRAEAPALPLTSVLMSPWETGSGVPQAVTGCHFNEITALGRAVDEGARISGFPEDMALTAVALRAPDGALRPAAAVEADIESAVAAATAGGRALLHVLDLSKTGLLAPGPEAVGRLRRRHGERLVIAIDACQARLGGRAMRRYLEDGHFVLVTGSKFFTGPPFAGAVIVPRSRARGGLSLAGLPAGLGSYSHSEDWPSAGATTGANAGLLLRWAAALAEMQGFAAVAPARRQEILARFGAALSERLTADGRLLPLSAPPPRRGAGEGWDALQTIFTFALADPRTPARRLDQATLARIYHWLNADLSDRLGPGLAAQPCHIGQPVRLGQQDGTALAGLRIAAGARLVSGEPSHARLDDATRIERELADLGTVVAKLGLILDHLPALLAEP